MAIKILGKKGIFFTFIALTLMAALIIIFTPTSVVTEEDALVVKTRVGAVNAFVVDLENSYLENILKVSSHNAILALTSYVHDNGAFADLNGLKNNFSEAMLQGTIGGIPQEIMDGNTIQNWTDRMANVSRNTLNVNSNFKPNLVSISQLRPFFVELALNINFSVESETALWNVTGHVVNAELSIQELEDPYYMAFGDYDNKINETNTLFNEWNTEKVLEHIAKGTYRYNEEAPSFLKRFTLDNTPTDCCGIESLVDSSNPLLSGQKDISYADYIFWRGVSGCPDPDLYRADGISSDMKFDFDHLTSYKITQDSEQICPPGP